MGTASRRMAAFMVAASAMTAGCGGDPAEVITGLTEQESLEIFNELMTAVFSAMSQSTASSFDPAGIRAAAAVTAAETFTLTSSCPLGGTVGMTITVNDNLNDNGTGTSTFSAVQTPSDCAVSTSSGTYTVNGAPNLSWGGSLNYVEFTPSSNYELTMSGGYDFDGTKSGQCLIDLRYNLNIQTGRGSMSGTMCGNAINTTF